MSKAAKTVAKRAPARGRIGSDFEALMKETGDYEAVTAVALKRVLAWQIGQEMKAQGVTKTALAKRMETSRSQLDRLLDPNNDEVTLSTLARAAAALGREIKLELA
jgi:antitoxin HicB